VEKVMGFCTQEQYEAFFQQVPEFERLLVDDGIALLDKWQEYTAAKVVMFERTSPPHAPWTVIRSNDKKRARIEAMRSLLRHLDYEGKDPEAGHAAGSGPPS
jgi:polyphosphate kinase